MILSRRKHDRRLSSSKLEAIRMMAPSPRSSHPKARWLKDRKEIMLRYYAGNLEKGHRRGSCLHEYCAAGDPAEASLRSIFPSNRALTRSIPQSGAVESAAMQHLHKLTRKATSLATIAGTVQTMHTVIVGPFANYERRPRQPLQ